MPVVVLRSPRDQAPYIPYGRLRRLIRDSGAVGIRHIADDAGDPPLDDEPAPEDEKGEEDKGKPVVEASKKAVAQADPLWWLIGIVLIVVGIWVGQEIYNPAANNPPTFKLSEGFNEFALFYILAQSLERMSEFVSYIPWVGIRIGSRLRAASKDGPINKEDANMMRQMAPIEGAVALAGGDRATAVVKATQGANGTLDAEVIASNRAVFFFAFNTAIAALLIGYFEVLVLQTAGVEGGRPWIDIAITALAIGGGTKPLHDLIQNIQKKNEESGDSTTTVTA